MLRALIPCFLCLVFTADPTLAEDKMAAGAVERLVLAWQTYGEGVKREDPVMVLDGIRLARGIGQRAATGWGGDQLDPPEDVQAQDTGFPRDPASEAALALALIMAEGDPDLADLAEEIAAEVTKAVPEDLVSVGKASVDPDQSDGYQIAMNGQVPAEIAVIGDDANPLRLQVSGPDGQSLCDKIATSAPAYCGFTPDQNDYFSVTISNQGKDTQAYLLLTN